MLAWGGSLDRDELAGRLAGALKFSDTDARDRIAELTAAGLLQTTGEDRARVSATDAGRQLHAQIRSVVDEITARMWGDLPAEDLAVAGRVLSTILARADAELAM
jgi:DNA-binding MarR family transcriptional regulator